MLGKNYIISPKMEKFKYFFAISLLGWYGWMLPVFLDFYVMRTFSSYWDFYACYGGDDVYYLFESVIIWVTMAAIIIVSKRMFMAVSITSIPLYFLAYVSRIKYVNRSELLTLEDLKLTEAAGMAANYLKPDFSGYAFQLLLLLIIVLLLTYGIDAIFALKRKKLNKRYLAIACPISAALIAFLFLFGAFFLNWDSHRLKSPQPEVEKRAQYLIYRFLENRDANFSDEGVIESYDRMLELVESLGKNRSIVDCKKKPNIIVIMNESWWNMEWADSNKMHLSKNPMKPIDDLGDDIVVGKLSANIYGGGTINSEGEFLTGLDTKYYVTASGMGLAMEKYKLENLSGYFKKLDYTTTYIHPFDGEFYSRDELYRNAGFDNVLFDSDMENVDYYYRYISDSTLAKQIIREYEKEKDSPSFIFGVSIANHRAHLEYDHEANKQYDFPIEVSTDNGILTEEDETIAKVYINGFYLAAEAFSELVRYFKKNEEPTVIVMFGDHFPDLPEKVLELWGLDLNNSSDEMIEKLYSVPVVMWKNYKLEKEDTLEIYRDAIYQLPRIMIEYAGLPDSKMTQILRAQSSEVKADTRYCDLDSEGRPIKQFTPEQIRVINDFTVIQYDIMLGEKYGKNLWTPLDMCR